ncbi:prepilin-type N-terminal cleavage/methylation domain-containing protein [Candidatus Saccharibacteria bacterium]|nr:prepilin-type N-terminal cleavage/methylation domain-containing protein [Candidatus Saccharibacteria bacterium]
MRTKHDVFKRSAGFTVVELMIATLVFSVILMVITFGVLSFTNRYYKGVNSSATQAAAQNIIDTLTQSVQFGAGAVDLAGLGAAPPYFCAGGNRFVFDKGVKFTGAQTGFYVGSQQLTCATASVTGRQLLGQNMRVANLDVTNVGAGFYTVDVTVAYGDDDLLCAPVSDPGSCASPATMVGFWDKPDMTCKPTNGTEFCAVSRLTTSIEKRVGG